MIDQDVWSFAHHAWLAGLWGLLPLGIFAVVVLRSRRAALARLLRLGLAVARPSAALHRSRLILTVLGFGFCLLALAQPRWGYQWHTLTREGLSVAVVLDVSRSMDAQDVSPSRMERARRELLDLAGALRGDRVGLVLVAGGAYPRMPLTLDTDAFSSVVRDSDTSTLKTQGSDLGRAIQVAADMLGPQAKADRAILIVSDGEDQQGKAADAAQAAADDGIHIFTLGVGTTDGAPIPVDGGGFKKDAGGSMVLTRLDRDLLAQLASIGSGAYADSVAGDSDIQALYVDGIRGGLQTAEQAVRREKIWQERFAWPLGIGLALLMLAAGLRSRAAAQAGAVLALSVLLGGFSAPARAADDQDQPTVTAPEPVAQSPLDQLLVQQVDHPNDLGLAERVAQALYQAGDFNRAREVLDSVAQRSQDPQQQLRARRNAGLAAYNAGRLTQAVDDWDQAASASPDDESAKANAEAVRQEIAKRLKQDQDQQDQDQQDQDQQDQDQQDSQDQQDQQDQQDSQDQQDQQDQQPQDQQDQEDPQDEDLSQARPADAQEGDTGESGDEEGMVEQPGTMSEQEADRLLEGVEEGTPRVELDAKARKGGKDW